MKYGFLRTAAASPELHVADCAYNADIIIECIKKADAVKAEVLVLPELCVTGYTCADLFMQRTLQQSAVAALEHIAQRTSGTSLLAFVGLPVAHKAALYNCTAALCHGKILGIVPKSYLPNYSEFYERRWFQPAPEQNGTVYLSEKNAAVPFGTRLLFADEGCPEICVAAELCEDLWVPVPPSVRHALNGALVIANPSASNEIIAKAAYRRMLVRAHSARICAAYVYADAGQDESTTDLVFAGHKVIAENGAILRQSELFSGSIMYADIDTERLLQERRRLTTWHESATDAADGYLTLYASFANDKAKAKDDSLFRSIAAAPFVPEDSDARNERCAAVIELQAHGLAKRLRHTGCRSAVIGLSGGLDSTLALMVTIRAFEIAGIEHGGIQAVTMPCFGTSERTFKNACALAQHTGATLRNIPIAQSVRGHFKDIGHNEALHDITYENSQARERTQVLMDIANQCGGLVIGTGDLSELALGWCTYNGDQMSMYGVNASIPKTLVRHLVAYFERTSGNKNLSAVLKDILDTPVSPELLPAADGTISQRTEDAVGPYRLHDFFLYYTLRFGFSPKKICFLAQHAFKSEFQAEDIRQWLRVFYKRFFAQQFKRSCMPDSAKVGTVCLSPRGDWRMPSDAHAELWLKEIDEC